MMSEDHQMKLALKASLTESEETKQTESLKTEIVDYQEALKEMGYMYDNSEKLVDIKT